MSTPSRPLHSDFQNLLEAKSRGLVDLYTDLRNFVLELYPEANELLYHTHALTSVYSVSQKLSDAFCHIPIYTEHLNLGLNEGTLLSDPKGLLKGTGRLIRHIEVKKPSDYRYQDVTAILLQAIEMALEDLNGPVKTTGKTFSKIKK